jgi:hypothetical protein
MGPMAQHRETTVWQRGGRKICRRTTTGDGLHWRHLDRLTLRMKTQADHARSSTASVDHPCSLGRRSERNGGPFGGHISQREGRPVQPTTRCGTSHDPDCTGTAFNGHGDKQIVWARPVGIDRAGRTDVHQRGLGAFAQAQGHPELGTIRPCATPDAHHLVTRRQERDGCVHNRSRGRRRHHPGCEQRGHHNARQQGSRSRCRSGPTPEVCRSAGIKRHRDPRTRS